MGRRALQSYLKYGYIPLEDNVKEAFHQNEQGVAHARICFRRFRCSADGEGFGTDCRL
jgi:hypothetical protein